MESQTSKSEEKIDASYRILGKTQFKDGDLEAASQSYRQAIELNPKQPAWVYQHLATIYNETKQIEKAISAYEKAIELEPENSVIYRGMAKSQFRKGDFQKATNYYLKAIELNADQPSWVYEDLANLFDKQGKLDDAIKAYQQLIEIKPDYFNAYNKIGHIYQRQSKFSDAISAYSRSLEVKPNQPKIASSLEEINQKIVLSKEKKSNGQIFKTKQTHTELTQQKEYQKKDINLAIEENTKFVKEYHKLGDLKKKESRLDEAITYYRKAIEIAPENYQFHHKIGEILAQQGHLDEAITCYRKAIELEPEQPWAYRGLGDTLEKQGQHEEAIANYRKAIQIKPNYDQAHHHLGISLKQIGKIEEADTCYTKALEINPKLNISTVMVTVVVPTYNGVHFLSECLDSVLHQTLKDWECIVVNDCSQDRSEDIAKRYVSIDSRFRIHNHTQNKGLSSARNTGIRLARGKYITFLDCDDFFLPNSLKERAELLNKETDSSVVGYYCGMLSVPEEAKLSEYQSEQKFNGTLKDFISCSGEPPFNAHAPLLKTSIVRKCNGFDETMLHGAEDWDFWNRLMRYGYSFKPTSHMGGVYRQKRNSMVRTSPIEHLAEGYKLTNSAFKDASDEFNSNYGPYLYKNSCSYYTEVITFTKRIIQFAAMSYMTGGTEAVEKALVYIPPNSYFYLSRHINIKGLIHGGVRRFLACDVDRYRSQNQGLSSIVDTIEKLIYARMKRSEEASTNQVQDYHKLEEHPAFKPDTVELSKFRNIHAGKRCFIVGNGPSLNLLDLTKLSEEYSFAVNGIFYKTDEMGFTPTYYVVEDSSVMKENIDRIKQYQPKKHKFFASIYRKLHPKDNNVSFYTMNRGFYEKTSPNYTVPRFSTDISDRIYCGQSVTYINLQIAFHMGFTEVYLIGMDFSYTIPDNFERQGDIITSTDDDPNHFHKDYFGKGKTWKDPKLERVSQNYLMAKLVYESAGRKIWNATAGGKLDVFERVDYESLF